MALVIEAQAVRPSARLQERGEPAFDAKAEDAVVRLVGEKDVSLGVGGRSFGKLEAVGQFKKFSPRSNDAGVRAQGSDAMCQDYGEAADKKLPQHVFPPVIERERLLGPGIRGGSRFEN